VYNRVAGVYWATDERHLAAQYLQSSLEIRQRIGDILGTADTQNNLGILAYAEKEYDRALRFYHQSLDIRRQVGDVLGIAQSLNNMGETHFSQGRLEEALQDLEQARDICLEIGEKFVLLDVSRTLAQVSRAMGNTANALELGQDLLETATAVGNREYAAVAHRLMGMAFWDGGDRHAALDQLEASLRILEEIDSQAELGQTCYELGRRELDQEGLQDQARAHLERAADIFRSAGAETELHRALRLLQSDPPTPIDA
jgi:tetratricopeptide (TPR) repeat protein